LAATTRDKLDSTVSYKKKLCLRWRGLTDAGRLAEILKGLTFRDLRDQ